MNQHASDTARVASTRDVDCWENEGGADRAPHQEDEMRHFGGRRKPKSWSPKKPQSEPLKRNS